MIEIKDNTNDTAFAKYDEIEDAFAKYDGIQYNTHEAVIAKYAEMKGRVDAVKAYIECENYPSVETIAAILGIGGKSKDE